VKYLRWIPLKSRFVASILASIALSSCGRSIPVPTTPATPGDRATATDPRDDCVARYDPSVDYFPDKAQIQDATGFRVEYHRHYKTITIREPWQDADRSFTYTLVQCGTPIPSGVDPDRVITIPVRSIVALSTTHLPHLDRLGVVDRLVGTGSADHISTPSVRDRLVTGKAIEVTRNLSTNIEAIIGLDPDLVMTHSIGDPSSDIDPKLTEAGLNVVLNAEYVERSPLGRAEWLKFTALFFNREAEANAQFATIKREYLAVAELVKTVAVRPTVLIGFSYQGTWYVAGGQSYGAQLLADAGANYLWRDSTAPVTLPLDFEAVYELAAAADIWLNLNPAWATRAAAIADDPRYGQFQAWQRDRMYNNTAKTNATGGNDYWETGLLEPQVILADLVQILHPDLLPDRELVYYEKLP
jgi:iron complex transport system substrate-binding protein